MGRFLSFIITSTMSARFYLEYIPQLYICLSLLQGWVHDVVLYASLRRLEDYFTLGIEFTRTQGINV